MTLNRHLPQRITPHVLSPVRERERAGPVVAWRYPPLACDDRTAIVRYSHTGIWLPANWLAEKLAEACATPHLSDSAREAFKAIGIKFVAKLERGPQP